MPDLLQLRGRRGLRVALRDLLIDLTLLRLCRAPLSAGDLDLLLLLLLGCLLRSFALPRSLGCSPPPGPGAAGLFVPHVYSGGGGAVEGLSTRTHMREGGMCERGAVCGVPANPMIHISAVCPDDGTAAQYDNYISAYNQLLATWCEIGPEDMGAGHPAQPSPTHPASPLPSPPRH